MFNNEYIYICRYPSFDYKIEKILNSESRHPRCSVVESTFEACKQRVIKIAKSRIVRIEEELNLAKEHLDGIINLEEE